MSKLSAIIGGTGAFVGGLFRRTSKRSKFSPNGHVVMEGWTTSPEEECLRRNEASSLEARRPTRVALYGISGPHSGDTFRLSNSVELVGKDADCSVVVTPGDSASSLQSGRCRVFINGTVRMLVEKGNTFKVNGMETEQAELFDYDEIECFGNKFLVLVTPMVDGKDRA